MKYATMIQLVAGTAKTSLGAAAAALDLLQDEIARRLLAGEVVRLPRLGTLSLTATRERPGRNPRTGAAITIAPGARGRFKPGRALKERAERAAAMAAINARAAAAE